LPLRKDLCPLERKVCELSCFKINPHPYKKRLSYIISVLKSEAEHMLKYKYYVFGHYPWSCLYLKHCAVYFSKHNISETGVCLHLQVKPTQLGPKDGNRIQSPKGCVLKNKQDGVLDKDKTMDNVQKHSICTNVPSSQTFRSYLHVEVM
jgi:hypothetical protein